ncbi:MAG: class I SAM-dependent methyltransferase [Chloroflexi bacterium]|nr:class I SAM-dependent methyltransferase [Chloroflexota bacterium]
MASANSGRTSAAFFLPHLRPGLRLLDCGCGVGSITIGLAAAVAPGEVIGLDLEPGQIDQARALAREHGVANVTFRVGSVYDLPFADGAFDAAFAHTLLMHLHRPIVGLREIKRVLRPGGVIGVADDDQGTMLLSPAVPLVQEFLVLHQRWLVRCAVPTRLWHVIIARRWWRPASFA